MQQRQLRLGDILDDYCPRERRVTNHAVVAMVGEDVKQTRCTTCDTEHEYKHARVPRQRRKNEPAALYAQVASGAPKKVVHEPAATPATGPLESAPEAEAPPEHEPREAEAMVAAAPEEFDVDRDESEEEEPRGGEEEGPVHRPLIRATLPRPAGQTPERPIPEFTMRQPAGRPHRFRPRHGGRGGAQVFGHAGNTATGRGGAQRQHGSRPGGHPNRRSGSGRKRSK